VEYIVYSIGYFPSSLYDGVQPDVPRVKFFCHPKSRDSLDWENSKEYLISYLELKGPMPPISIALLAAPAALIRSWITLTLSVVAKINSAPIVKVSSISYQQSGVLHFLPYSASYGAMPILAW